MSVAKSIAAPRAPAPKAAAREVQATLSDVEFREIAALVETLTGIVVPIRKKQLVTSRLGKRLRALGLPDFQAYIARVSGPGAKEEIGEFINAMTTNLTSFFREEHHFHDLDGLLRRHPGGRLRIWSAACSTGEEPYSIAMTAIETGAVRPGADFRILATDLDTRALGVAREGVYSADQVEDCPAPLRRKYFTAAAGGRWRTADRLRGVLTFNRLNLHEEWPVRGPFDVIFCRNVLIYFGMEAKQSIVSRFVELLPPGGTLYLGHSEAMLGNHPQLVSEGRTIFRKRPA